MAHREGRPWRGCDRQRMIIRLLNSLCPGWRAEYRFHPSRRWRFDFAHEGLKVAVEIEGAIWVHGRHTRGKGFLGDMEKYNQAQLFGWKILRYEPKQMAGMMKDVECLCSKNKP